MRSYRVRNTIEKAGQAIVSQSADHQAGWVLYLLEILDTGEDDETYGRLLSDVGDGIATRLATGGW